MEKKRPNPLYEIQDMENEILKATEQKELPQTAKALFFAKEKHEGQKRKEGIPYIIHPYMLVFTALMQGIEEDELLAVMLLHDVCEDCNVEVEKLPFSQNIKEAVDLLSFKIKENETKAQAKKRYFMNMRHNRLSVITKIFDRCHNISSMGEVYSFEKMRRYIDETRTYIMPMLNEAIKIYPEYSNVLSGMEYHMKSVIYMAESLINRK